MRFIEDFILVSLAVAVCYIPVNKRLEALEGVVRHTHELNVQLSQQAQDAMDAKQLEYDSIIDNLPEGIWR